MKPILSKIFLCGMLLLAMSCSSDDAPEIMEVELTCFDGILNGDEVTVDCGGACPGFCPTESEGILEGELVSRIQLEASVEYRLTGPYLVRDKAELSIPAGTVIKADPGKGAYIAVAQGGRLNVFGQPDNPVIITSGAQNPVPGDWGGIVISGRAPINGENLGRSDIIDIFYGGSTATDTSGVLNYLRVEYAGAEVNDRKFDAIAFYGVGSLTTVTRVQAFESLGNGIRFIGGTVNTKWVVATNNGENAIAMTNDWSGKGEFWHLSGSKNAGIQIRSDIENPPQTAIDSIRNISIIGPSLEIGLDYTSGNGRYTFTNVYTNGLSTGIRVDNAVVSSNIELGNLQLDSVEFDNPQIDFIPTNYTGDNTSFYTEATTDGAGNRAQLPNWTNGWTRGID
ncbi:hypothetical protein FGM00_00325 [Aggregatimonas sangjinii]|uniref:Uncharacterized protein n=1 Tax=Aggregatimonas sangjinii TaxID=2583587 RepID=A0A5B7SNL9_9FLAO|nr:hypothetical protein [Aggregatimonas sangjinii]QCW98639.1 hypothetical protein FGM00_00325 [Aggregatimonas sangjinii]